MSALISGLVAAIIVAALDSLFRRNKKNATVTPNGWNALTPGSMINVGLLCSIAGAALAAGFLIVGGSGRPDAAIQNALAIVFIVIFLAAGFYIFWQSYGRTIMWKGNALRVRSMFRKEEERRFSDVTQVKENVTMQEYRVTFRDGSRLRFSAYLRGADEFVAKLNSALP